MQCQAQFASEINKHLAGVIARHSITCINQIRSDQIRLNVNNQLESDKIFAQ